MFKKNLNKQLVHFCSWNYAELDVPDIHNLRRALWSTKTNFRDFLFFFFLPVYYIALVYSFFFVFLNGANLQRCDLFGKKLRFEICSQWNLTKNTRVHFHYKPSQNQQHNTESVTVFMRFFPLTQTVYGIGYEAKIQQIMKWQTKHTITQYIQAECMQVY